MIELLSLVHRYYIYEILSDAKSMRLKSFFDKEGTYITSWKQHSTVCRSKMGNRPMPSRRANIYCQLPEVPPMNTFTLAPSDKPETEMGSRP